MTSGFIARQESNGEGVGDDDHSWAFDGQRQQKWHAGPSAFGSQWRDGDVVGFAADMTNMDDITLSLSVNGCFDAPDGVGFSGTQNASLHYCLFFRNRMLVHTSHCMPPDSVISCC